MAEKTSKAMRRRKSNDVGGSDLSFFFPVAKAVAALLHPHAEVVLHDLVTDRITGIWNSFSGRKAGDPSSLGNDPALQTEDDVFGPYEKAERDGSRVKSISGVLRDARGQRTGYLCINLDMSKFDAAISLLRGFVETGVAMPEVLFKRDLREQVNLLLKDELVKMNKAVSALTREDRKRIVARLDAANVFQARNAVPLVASTLGIGRANLYYILRSVRGETGAPETEEPKDAKPARSNRRSQARPQMSSLKGP